MKKIKIFSTIFAAILSTTLFIGTCFAVTIPEKPSNYVTDLANVLTQQEEDLLNEQIKQIEKNTTAEIAILTIPNLEEQNEDLENLTYDVFNKWGIGKKDVDNGILILTAIDDRQFRIETGRGTEGVITDYEARLVAEKNLIPGFKAGNYYGGFEGTVKDFGLFLAEDPYVRSEYQTIASNEYESNFSNFSIYASFIIAVIISGIIGSLFKKDKSSKIAKIVTGGGFFAGGLTLIILGLIIGLGVTLLLAGILLILFSGSSGGGGGGTPFFFGGGGSSGFGGGGFGGGFGGFGGGGSSGGGFSGGW